jgi:hypothetical protein
MSSFLNTAIPGRKPSAFGVGRPLAALLADTGSQLGPGSPAALSGYAAFISYSHRDSAIARWLHKAIENFRMPRELVGTTGEYGPVPARLRPVFRDEDELASASELGPRLEHALAASRALIVICSPAAAASVWVDKEIRTFKRVNPAAPVLAVLVRGLPEGSFPQSLRYAIDDRGEIDESRPVEPLAPDLATLDRRVVKLKLIAGLAGVSYAALERRDLRRRRRIAAILAAAAITLIAVLSALTVTAIKARNVAVEERNKAIAARELAEKRTWLAQQAAKEIRNFAFSAACSPNEKPASPH